MYAARVLNTVTSSSAKVQQKLKTSKYDLKNILCPKPEGLSSLQAGQPRRGVKTTARRLSPQPEEWQK